MKVVNHLKTKSLLKIQVRTQITTRVRLCTARHVFRRSTDNDFTTTAAALGAEIDDMISGFDHVQVVFDNHDAVARLYQSLQNTEQTTDVIKMQAGGWFVKYEQFALQVTGTVADIAGKFETLGLAAGHGVDRLAQADISQTHIGQRLERRYHLFVFFEKLQGLVHRHG